MTRKVTGPLRDAIRALPVGEHELSITGGTRDVCVKIRKDPKAKAVLFIFHGAVDRKTRTLPVFVNFLPELAGRAHQVVIADPSLTTDSANNVAWYAGDSEFDAQGILPGIFGDFAAGLDADRRIYFGTSSGGFAALYYSHQDPGSFAIAGNPQVRIMDYHLGHAVRRYRETCWPQAATNDALSDVTQADLCSLYSNGFQNTVIYVQSSGDRNHFERQFLGFSGAVAKTSNRTRLITTVDYWGRMGHFPAPKEYLAWVQAICQSPETEVENLLNARYALKPDTEVPVRAAAKAPKKSFDPKDIAMIEQIKAWHAPAR